MAKHRARSGGGGDAVGADECVVAGLRSADALLRAGRLRRLFFAGDNRNPLLGDLRDAAKRAGAEVSPLPDAVLNRLAGGDNHQGVVAVASLPAADFAALLRRHERPLVALDGVTDPRNLGAVLRIARAFDAAAVVLPKRRSAPLTAAAGKVSSGAVAHVPVARVVNMARALAQARDAGWTVAGAAEDAADDVFRRPPPPPVLWLFGDESGGLRRLSRRYCDVLLRAPTVAGDGGCLNVAAACAVCLAATRAARQSSDK